MDTPVLKHIIRGKTKVHTKDLVKQQISMNADDVYYWSEQIAERICIDYKSCYGQIGEERLHDASTAMTEVFKYATETERKRLIKLLRELSEVRPEIEDYDSLAERYAQDIEKFYQNLIETARTVGGRTQLANIDLEDIVNIFHIPC